MIKYEMKMNHKNTENSCHGTGNMPVFEIKHAGSIASHWKYDSDYWKSVPIHIKILKLKNI